MKPEEKNDPKKVAARRAEIETQFQTSVDRVVSRFVKLFAAASGQPQDDFFATVDQALFFRNGNELRSWLSPSGGNLADRLQQIDDPNSLAEEMYLSILTRRPTREELDEVVAYLKTPDLKKSDAVGQMAWALFTSAEFRFQH